MTAASLLEVGAADHCSGRRVASSERIVRVALAGCGTVGGALARQLREHAGVESGRVEVVRVLVRDVSRARRVAFAPGVLTDDAASFSATACDVTVEAMGGLNPAREIVARALSSGRRVVTANKELVAAHGVELAQLAARHGGALDFGAAVGGCIPVVRALRAGAAGLGVRAVSGVLNGTSNFVLSRMGEGASRADAIAEAQRRGFAEADPSRDLDGRDAAAKIAILAWLAFGVEPSVAGVRRRSLDDGIAFARAACEMGAVVRQVAECVEVPSGIVASVEPAVVAPQHALGRVEGEANAVAVESESAGWMVLAGRGAGGDPTAGAMYADIRDAALPLPVPPFKRAVVPDERELKWILLTRASVELLRAAVGTALVQERVRAAGERALYAFSGTAAAAARGALRAVELDPGTVWLRDLR